jgi:hypothetical protein
MDTRRIACGALRVPRRGLDKDESVVFHDVAAALNGRISSTAMLRASPEPSSPRGASEYLPRCP